MNPPRAYAEDYMDFLIATPKACKRPGGCTCPAEFQPQMPAHDAFTRLLRRSSSPGPENLWLEAASQVNKDDGVLVLDDSTLDKPYAKDITLVGRHWSGKRNTVVQGISLVSLLWTDGDLYIPCDYRIFHKPGRTDEE